jgi:hypothetical protein
LEIGHGASSGWLLGWVFGVAGYCFEYVFFPRNNIEIFDLRLENLDWESDIGRGVVVDGGPEGRG